MIEFLEYTPEELYKIVQERARAEGVANQEAWDSIVEDVLADKMGWGEVSVDDNTVRIREDLKGKYATFKAQFEAGAV